MFSIRWETGAIKEQNAIFEFWNQNNKSKTYSRKIFKEIKRIENLLVKNPNMGILTDFCDVRKLVVMNNFSLFYSIEKQTINILTIWDNRRNPNDLVL